MLDNLRLITRHFLLLSYGSWTKGRNHIVGETLPWPIGAVEAACGQISWTRPCAFCAKILHFRVLQLRYFRGPYVSYRLYGALWSVVPRVLLNFSNNISLFSYHGILIFFIAHNCKSACLFDTHCSVTSVTHRHRNEKIRQSTNL